MSKKSPRETVSTRPGRRPPAVFRSSYTYKGRLMRTKGWHVKIQHDGVRRTLALSAMRREEAVEEAGRIHQLLVTQGWDALGLGAGTVVRGRGAPAFSEGNPRELRREDIAHWEERLVQRRYPAPEFRMLKGPEWSVRLTRNGISSHFPLGTMDRRQAAVRALEIQKRLDADGWDSVCRTYSRELTLGFHWSLNPVVWTYTTVHTCTAHELVVRNRNASKGGVPVMIIESDENLRCALEHWCGFASGFRTTGAVGSAEEALRQISQGWQGICLINHSLRDMSGHQCLERLNRHSPGVRGFIYSSYEDSEQLFVATPGGAAAYLYRRVTPDEILQPLAGRLMRWPMTDDELRLRLRRYLEDSLKIGISTGPTRALESLTGRERQILELLSGGHVEKEIASSLGISIWTVHGHVKRIFEKLGVRTRTEAVVKYLQK